MRIDYRWGAVDADRSRRYATELLALAPDVIGICGEAPANYPEIARYLAELGIDSISVNRSSILRTMQVVSDAESHVKLTDGSSNAAE